MILPRMCRDRICVAAVEDFVHYLDKDGQVMITFSFGSFYIPSQQ